MPSVLRFLRQLLRPRPDAVVREETSYRRDDGEHPASLYRPTRGRGPLPGWVVLHGVTHRGRDHEGLDTFVRALAASGAAVLVPDIPECRTLRIAPGATIAATRAAVLDLDDRPFIQRGRVGVIGFSFGGTQALVAATDPALDGRLAAAVSWGGYLDFRRTVGFAFLGRHELDGAAHHLEPDPYGRWVLAGNYLTGLPEHRQHHALADALLWMAREIGRRKLLAWQPTTDPLKREAGDRLDPEQRALFDRFAPLTTATPSDGDREWAAELAPRLADAAMAAEPLLDPSPYLPRVPVPLVLAHGRDDRLIPWTEMVRLRRALPAARVRDAAVTRLFGHSFREKRLPTPAMVADALGFLRCLRTMVRLT